jgi:UDP-N-acetylmuramate--alanine ligase
LRWTISLPEVRLMYMHIFFSGIGGTGLGPLALIAHQAGHKVSGSDKQDSQYIHYLQGHGISDIHIGQSTEQIQEIHNRVPIDWYVFSSAVAIEQPDAPELRFCRENSIKMTKRDELLNHILVEKDLKLIAIAGTHGKTTTTAMAIWLCTRLGIPASYSVGGKISFGEMGHFDPDSEYFVYEADEFDRNFLSFRPYTSLITGIDWDHPDIYPTRGSYQEAFKQFITQSVHTIIWDEDARQLGLSPTDQHTVLDKSDPAIQKLRLTGVVNREDAWQVAETFSFITGLPIDELLPHLEAFPGVSRRFEQLAPNLYTDYAHTPEKIRGTLETAEETAPGKVVVVYEGLHNTRQHFIKDELVHIFDTVKQLYIVPSYLAREDESLPLLSPDDLKKLLSDSIQSKTTPASLDDNLKNAIQEHLVAGDTVVCISAGGGGSLDEWLRREFIAPIAA